MQAQKVLMVILGVLVWLDHKDYQVDLLDFWNKFQNLSWHKMFLIPLFSGLDGLKGEQGEQGIFITYIYVY